MLLKGKVILYFATGEESRPQFIGDNSVDANGFVLNFKEVYDLSIGDKVSIQNPNFTREEFVIDEMALTGLTFLMCIWQANKGELDATFEPGPESKSWDEITKAISK